jgi:hypothetical protein
MNMSQSLYTLTVVEYIVSLTLISRSICEDFPADWLAGWDSTGKFLDNHYFGNGGAAVIINPDRSDGFSESPFGKTHIDVDEDPARLVLAADESRVLKDVVLEDGSHEVHYQMCPTAEVTVVANSENEAKGLCLSEITEWLQIFDPSGLDDVGIREIEIGSVFLA